MQDLIDTPDNYAVMSETELLGRIAAAKANLGSRLYILGHHYQCDEVIRFSDSTGDSFQLSQAAARSGAPHIVFLGVHFMAESADILTSDDQIVILPDLTAGCSMADMASIRQLERGWRELHEAGLAAGTLPVTYMNSTAAIKAFCGRQGGAVCTSSNARRALEWAWSRGERVLFLPDQHLGRNTAVAMGLDRERDLAIWDPALPLGGLTPERLRAVRLLLWKGHCSVHTKFSAADVARVRREDPAARIVVHPECVFEVAQAADQVGSTKFIADVVAAAPPGARLAIGTEIHLTYRLAAQYPDKVIYSLAGMQCLCSTMYRIDPPHLCWALENLVRGRVVNRIDVPPEIKAQARAALERMLAMG